MPRRPSIPRTPPRIIGARRLALLKPVDSEFVGEPVCSEGVVVVDERVSVVVGSVVVGITSSLNERTDQELLEILKMLILFESVPSPPERMARFREGSKASEVPSIVAGSVED